MDLGEYKKCFCDFSDVMEKEREYRRDEEQN